MIFEWDERKRRANLAKHGLDFVDCRALFAGPTSTYVDDRFPYGELRFVTFGLLADRVVAATHAEKDDVIRLISMRWASKHEQTHFFETIQGFKNSDDLQN